MARVRQVIELTKEEEAAVRLYLLSEISGRELGRRLGMGHQIVRERVGLICLQWVQEGKLRFGDGK